MIASNNYIKSFGAKIQKFSINYTQFNYNTCNCSYLNIETNKYFHIMKF